MTEKSPEKLAEVYSDALESQANEEEYEQTKELLNGLTDRLNRFEDTYGESDTATQELREKVESTKEELEELEREKREPEKLEQELLQAATQFVVNEEWLQPKVIKALNKVLVGSAHSTLRVEEVEVSEPIDIEEVNDLSRYDIIDIIRRLAMDKLGESDDLKQIWNAIEGSVKEGPFRIVVETGGATPKKVMEKSDEDIDRVTANNRLKDSIHYLDINPYHREDGTYHLSTVGRYIAVEYVKNRGQGEDTHSDKDATETDSGDEQTTLLSEKSLIEEGEADE